MDIVEQELEPMAQVDSKSLEKLILELASAFQVGKAVRRVDIEPDEDDGTLRIVLSVEDLDKADVAELVKLIDAVEDSLSERDDRFPSVRFAEAA